VKHLLLSAATASLALCVLIAWSASLTSRARRFAAGSLLLVLLAVAVRPLAIMVQSALRNPPMWDFRCFWVWGRIALGTRAVYAPASSLTFARMFPFDPEWFKQFLVVGFIYPPPSILLYAPLGLFGTPALAAPYWYAVQLLALGAAIVILWRKFLKHYGWLGLLAVAILVCSFRATTATFMYGQPLTLLLLLLSLYAADGSASRRGVWLGLAFIVKPMAIVFFVLPLLRRAWREFVVGVATIFAGFAGAIVLLGWKNVAAYFSDGPSNRYPLSIWLDPGNESLFSIVLRYTHASVPSSLSHAGTYWIAVTLLTIMTLLLCIKARAQDPETCFAMLIPYALLVFPPSGGSYNDVLLIPVLLLVSRYGARSTPWVIGCVSLLYLIWSPVAFLAPFSLWLIYAAIIVRGQPQFRSRYFFASSSAR
jgi:hypothetical protein